MLQMVAFYSAVPRYNSISLMLIESLGMSGDRIDLVINVAPLVYIFVLEDVCNGLSG